MSLSVSSVGSRGLALVDQPEDVPAGVSRAMLRKPPRLGYLQSPVFGGSPSINYMICRIDSHRFCVRSLTVSAFPIINRRKRVLIADDHAVIRKIVRLTLQRFPQFEVCGEAEDGIQAVEQAKKANPDVVILNVVMPCLNGFEAARELSRKYLKPQS